MNKKNDPRFSERIKDICTMFDDVVKDHEWHGEQVNRMDQLTQDYLHKLELDGLKYEERAKVATQLAKCRQERRQHKDAVIILDPLVEYLETENGKRLLNLLREVLGKTRKAEAYMQTRMYFPRVLKEEKTE